MNQSADHKRLAFWGHAAGTLLLLALLNFAFGRVSFPVPRSRWNPQELYATLPLSGPAGALSAAERQAASAVYAPAFSDTQPTSIKTLYLTNSQAYLVANQQNGDLPTPAWLQIQLVRHSQGEPAIQVRDGSLPDLTYNEFLVKLVASGEAPADPVDMLIGGIALRRPTQENTLRPEVCALLTSPNVKNALQNLALTNPDLPAAGALIASNLQGGGPNCAPVETNQPPWERHLQAWLDSRLPLFARREQMREWLILRTMFWRNQVFSVTSATPRPYPKSAYQTNQELLEMSLRYARAKGIHVLLYLQPVRPRQPNPTTAEDLAQFRADLPSICSRYAIPCYDYSSLIPESDWGMLPVDDENGFGGQPDYYHFVEEGHQLLAEKLFLDLWPHIEAWQATQAQAEP